MTILFNIYCLDDNKGKFNPTSLTYGILFFMWSEYLWNMYLFLREYRTITSTVEVPPELNTAMTSDTFDCAKAYTLAKMRFALFMITLTIVLTSYELYYGQWPRSWNYARSQALFGKGEVSTTCTSILISSATSLLIDMPAKLYVTFCIEHRFGFNKQTVGFFVRNQIKNFVFEQVMLMLITSAIIPAIKSGGHFLWLWFLIWSVSLFFGMVYFSMTVPMFRKYTPLPPGALRTEIETMAAQLDMPLTQIYLMKSSRVTLHSNAFVIGMPTKQAIVLFDTLIANGDGSRGCSNQEIVAILCHELGHWKYHHTVIDYILLEIDAFFGLVLFAKLFDNPEIYRAVGFYDSQPVIVGMVTVLQFVLIPYHFAWEAVKMWTSKRFELQADEFAIEVGKAESLRSALIQLHKDNLEFPVHDRLFSQFNLSHPSLLERLDAVNNVLAKRN